MKIFCTASLDNYITDKIIDGTFRAEDANVGRAGTLDLFKLWNETTINGSGSQDEISRILVKFDYQKIHDLTASVLDLNSSNFNATMRLFDTRTGNAVPANFNIVVFPLSQSFSEGVGRDVLSFGDLDDSNFLTASYANGVDVLWNTSGANAAGALGDSGIDIIATANFNDGDGLSNIFQSQNFPQGTENLSVNVTQIVSATVAGQIPNYGFRVSFSGSDESDTKTRFVKRFASRHVADPLIRPRIEVSFDESLQDNHMNFFSDLSGSLFLNSYERSSAAPLVSGSALTPITGSNCLLLKLQTGSFSHVSTASQYSRGTIDSAGENFLTGVYSSTIAIPSNDTSLVASGSDATLSNWLSKSGSIVMEEYWYSLDGNVGFYTGSIKIEAPSRTSSNFTSQEPFIQVINAKSEYKGADETRFRLFGRDLQKEYNQPVRVPIKLAPIIFDQVYYRVRDVDSGRLIFDFDKENNSTRVSTDSEGMFFDFHMDILPLGRSYTLEFLIVNRGVSNVVEDARTRFTVR